MEQPEFISFNKIPRLHRECVVTEKIDGTNAQIVISEDPTLPIMVGSRNRWITPGKTTDNYGFAAWVAANESALRLLGPGRHFGEWYGVGIARGYGLSERRWALFNVTQWKDKLPEGLPSNVHVVPLLEVVPSILDVGVHRAVYRLQECGSFAVPGFMDPEGIVVYHKAAGQLFKMTFGGDGVSTRKTPSPIENP